MSTYQDLYKLQMEQLGLFQAPDELYLPYERKLQEVHIQVALDNNIPIDETPENKDIRIRAFKELAHSTKLSTEATALLQEALALRKPLLASLQVKQTQQ